PSKEFELLSLLVSKRPNAVSKDEFQDALWPLTTVTETSLTTLVKELRTKLGQEGREGPIRTVHGFGYALEDDGVTSAQEPAPRLLRGAAEIRLASPELILGREPGLPGTIDDASVSRRHARLRWDGTGVFLADLGSKNGTFVRGVRVSEPVALEDGDEIRLGLVSFVYRAPRSAGESTTKTVA
ncbi:MAG TPA: FHA domain-containing protein, partial [Thermoanaerobaculia bacterium]|nr:FHA domain-containing protein [Thermoanaerobaculia bacterium]